MPKQKTRASYIVKWVGRYLPTQGSVREYIETIKTKVEEIITYNLSNGWEPISPYAIKEIFDFFKHEIILSFEKTYGERDEITYERAIQEIEKAFQEAYQDIIRKYYS